MYVFVFLKSIFIYYYLVIFILYANSRQCVKRIALVSTLNSAQLRSVPLSSIQFNKVQSKRNLVARRFRL